MRHIVIVLGFVVSFVAFADTRIEHNDGGQTCHIPYNEENTDKEYKLPCIGILKERGGLGAIEAWGRVEVTNVPRKFAPKDYVITSDDTVEAEPCTMVNDDGQDYTTDDWIVQQSKVCAGNRCTAVYEILCGYTSF